GNRQANAQGGTGGQGMRGGGPGGGGFNGPRPGGSGGQGGFGNMTPEEREQAMARFRPSGGGNAAGGGGFSGQRPNFTGQRAGGMGGFGNMNASAAPGAGPRPAQRRNGTVMVKLADGNLEARRIVYGVTNRVHAEVLEGLKEGEVVIVGRSEAESAAAP